MFITCRFFGEKLLPGRFLIYFQAPEDHDSLRGNEEIKKPEALQFPRPEEIREQNIRSHDDFNRIFEVDSFHNKPLVFERELTGDLRVRYEVFPSQETVKVRQTIFELNVDELSEDSFPVVQDKEVIQRSISYSDLMSSRAGGFPLLALSIDEWREGDKERAHEYSQPYNQPDEYYSIIRRFGSCLETYSPPQKQALLRRFQAIKDQKKFVGFFQEIFHFSNQDMKIFTNGMTPEQIRNLRTYLLPALQHFLTT